MPDTDRTAEAEDMLQRILEQAADHGADMIEFERVPRALEITYFISHAGIGTLLEDGELIAALFRLVAQRTRRRRSFTVTIRGHSQTIKCEWYESFMEDCFRLRFVKPKLGCDVPRKTSGRPRP